MKARTVEGCVVLFLLVGLCVWSVLPNRYKDTVVSNWYDVMTSDPPERPWVPVSLKRVDETPNHSSVEAECKATPGCVEGQTPWFVIVGWVVVALGVGFVSVLLFASVTGGIEWGRRSPWPRG